MLNKKLLLLIFSLVIIIGLGIIMKNYEDLGLNSRLQKIGGLADKDREWQGAYSFDALTDRNIITTTKVKNLSADSITSGTLSFDRSSGGTLTLGGTNNASGVFSLKDEGGTEKISMDKDGMTINDGNITINDSAGSTVIDSKGLVSTTSFSGDSVGTGETNITSTSYQDITDATLTTPSFTRNTLVLFLYSVRFQVATANGDAHGAGIIGWNLDGAAAAYSLAIQKYMVDEGTDGEQIQNRYNTQTTHHIVTLGTGTHTMKMQGKVINVVGTCKLTIYNSRLSYIVLGK